MMWVSSATKGNKQIRKGQPSYEVCRNELRQKEDHPKDPLN